LGCSTAHGGLCHETSVQPVTQPNRSSATRPIDHYLGGFSLHWLSAPFRGTRAKSGTAVPRRHAVPGFRWRSTRATAVALQCSRDLSDQPLQRLARPGAQLLAIERVVAVPVGGFESFLDGREILVLRQGAVMVAILGRQLLGAQPALQFAA